LPRLDDYTAAFDLAARALLAKDPAQVAALAGAAWDGLGLTLALAGQAVRVRLDPVTVSAEGGPALSLTDQVLVLHYLTQADGRPVAGEWIAFREMPGAQTYHPVFYQRAISPLKAGFGANPALLVELAQALGATPGAGGDAAVIVPALPRVPLLLQVFAGDEDLPAEANVLFDRSAPGYLSAEDAAWLAGRVVYPLVGRARAGGGRK
jgi:hypothetical protein